MKKDRIPSYKGAGANVRTSRLEKKTHQKRPK